MKRTRFRPLSKKTGRRRPGRDAARRHVLARTTMAPVGHCEYAAGGPGAPEPRGAVGHPPCGQAEPEGHGGAEQPAEAVPAPSRHFRIQYDGQAKGARALLTYMLSVRPKTVDEG